MKLEFSKTLILILIVSFNFNESNSKRLKKRDGDKTLPSASTNNKFIDPREHTNPKTRNLALEQTMWARNLIYFPDEILFTQMQLAAIKINKFLEFLNTKSDEEGQADIEGESGDILGETLGIRILTGGILKGKPYSELKRTFERFEDNVATPNDKMVLIAMLGDIGVLALDTSSEVRDAVQTARLTKILQKFASFCKTDKDVNCFSPDDKEIIKPQRTSTHVGPSKSKERKKKESESRTGIFNLGKEADEKIGIVVADRIEETSSPVMAINKKRLEVEPWAGHMSGSPTEILYAWDIFTKDPPLISFQSHNKDDLPLDSQNRQAKAAGTSAFLIATGYHSAVECLEATYAYIGQDFRANGQIASGQNAGHSFDNGIATRMFVNLFKKFTNREKVISLEEKIPSSAAVKKYRKK